MGDWRDVVNLYAKLETCRPFVSRWPIWGGPRHDRHPFDRPMRVRSRDAPPRDRRRCPARDRDGTNARRRLDTSNARALWGGLASATRVARAARAVPSNRRGSPLRDVPVRRRHLAAIVTQRANLGIDRTPCHRSGHRHDLHVDRDGLRLCAVCNGAAQRFPCSRTALELERNERGLQRQG